MNSIIPEDERLRESAEDYLEAIGKLCEESGHAQVSDIAIMLNVMKPSVTAALRKLRDEGLINYKLYTPVTLTDKGKQYSAQIMKAHNILSRFLQQCGGLELERADQAACHLEHWLTAEEIKLIESKIQATQS